MAVAMEPRTRRPCAEGPSASDPTLSFSEADWSAGFSSGSFGTQPYAPLEYILAGAGPGHYQPRPQPQLQPQSQLQAEHRPHHQHQQQQQHRLLRHFIHQRDRKPPSHLVPREPHVRRCYTQPLGPVTAGEGFVEQSPQPLPGGIRQAQLPHLPPRSDPTALQVLRLQLTAKQQGQSRLPGRGRIGRRATPEEWGQGPRQRGAWAWLLQPHWRGPTGNQGTCPTGRKPAPSRGARPHEPPEPSRISPGQKASRRRSPAECSAAPGRRRSLSSPVTRRTQPQGRVGPGLRSKHPMTRPLPSGAGSNLTTPVPGGGGFLGGGATSKLAQEHPHMGSAQGADLTVPAEDRGCAAASGCTLAGTASSRGMDNGGRGCSLGEDTMSLCSLNSSNTSLSTSSSTSARALGGAAESGDSPTILHESSHAYPLAATTSKVTPPSSEGLGVGPQHGDSAEGDSVGGLVESREGKAALGSKLRSPPEEGAAPCTELPLPPGRQRVTAQRRLRSRHPSAGLWIRVPQQADVINEEEEWRGRALGAPVVLCQTEMAVGSGVPAFKKSWSGPLAAITWEGPRPDSQGRGSVEYPAPGALRTEDGGPREAVWDARAGGVAARPPRIPPPLPRFPGLPAPRDAAAAPASPTGGALERAASCSAASSEAAPPTEVLAASGFNPEAPGMGPEPGRGPRRSQSVQREKHPRNGAQGGERKLSTPIRNYDAPAAADSVWRWKNLQAQAQRMVGAGERGSGKAGGTGAASLVCSPTPGSRRSSAGCSRGGSSTGGRESSARPGLRPGSVAQPCHDSPAPHPAMEAPIEEQRAGTDEAWDISKGGSHEEEAGLQGQPEEGQGGGVDFSAIFSQKRADRKQGRPVGMVPAFGRPLSLPHAWEGMTEQGGGSQRQGKGRQPGPRAHEAEVPGAGTSGRPAENRPAHETGGGLRSRQEEAPRPGAPQAAASPSHVGGQDSSSSPLRACATPARGVRAAGGHGGAAATAAARAVGPGEAGASEPSQQALAGASPRTLKLRTISQHIQPSSPLFHRASQSSAYIQVQRSSSVTSSSRPPHAPGSRAKAPLPPSRASLPPSRATLPHSRPKARVAEGQQQEKHLTVTGGRTAQQHGVPAAPTWGDLPALGLGLQAFVRRATGERERGRQAPDGQSKGSHRPAGLAKESVAPASEEGREGAAPGAAPPEGHPDYSLLFSQAREERRKGRVSPILPCALQPRALEGAPPVSPSQPSN